MLERTLLARQGLRGPADVRRAQSGRLAGATVPLCTVPCYGHPGWSASRGSGPTHGAAEASDRALLSFQSYFFERCGPGVGVNEH
jgi:hypothetical protein